MQTGRHVLFAMWVVIAWPIAGAAQVTPIQVINLNETVNPAEIGAFVSNNATPTGAGLIVIGPNEEQPGQPPVDHTRIVQMGFGVDPIFSCYFANGDARNMTVTGNREALCTFQARGCAALTGCRLNGEGFALSTAQLRILSCQDWTPTGRGTRVQLSTTAMNSTVESAKVNWDDGGHIEYGNFQPSLGEGCGANASIEGTDNAFRVTIGAGGTERCLVTFHNAWRLPYADTPYRPMCTVNNESRDARTRVYPISTLIEIRGIAPADEISVICVGRHDLP